MSTMATTVLGIDWPTKHTLGSGSASSRLMENLIYAFMQSGPVCPYCYTSEKRGLKTSITPHVLSKQPVFLIGSKTPS